MPSSKMPNYKVWDPLNESEEDGFECEEWDEEAAACAYMENWYDNGNYEGGSTNFELQVRHLGSGELFKVSIDMDWSPNFYASVID